MGKTKKQRSWPDLEVVQPLPVPVMDNHTHLPIDGEEFAFASQAPSRDALTLVELAHEVGVNRIITSACEAPSWLPTLQMARELMGVRVAVAIHPNEAAMHAGVRAVAADGLQPHVLPHHEVELDVAMVRMTELVRSHSDVVVAIGETGMDLFRTNEQGLDAQRESMRAHIALAKELNLPLQIHDRDAHEQCIEVLEKDGAPERTIFHCFSGDTQMADHLTSRGWYASVAGPVTYKANGSLREAIARIPGNLLLCETDAPYLSPVPWRGRPNGSYMMPATVRFLAEQRGLSLETMCEQLDANSTAVYGAW
ncbi:TatD family hydrolase [Actinomyces vulturis]|uniref:TatD family hydrolase n=1 Tax=Actinomyces vulturis TaxID=1857645 RepID=UPI00082FAE17|nr:TatD family hydrolase [Actinomyces vulturis]